MRNYNFLCNKSNFNYFCEECEKGYFVYHDVNCVNDDKSGTLVENKPYTKEDYCKAYLGYNFLNYIALGREKSDEIRKMDKQQLMEFIEECNKKPYYDVDELYHKYIPNYGGEYKSEFFELAIKSANEGVMQTNGQAAANLVGDVEPIKYAYRFGRSECGCSRFCI